MSGFTIGLDELKEKVKSIKAEKDVAEKQSDEAHQRLIEKVSFSFGGGGEEEEEDKNTTYHKQWVI